MGSHSYLQNLGDTYVKNYQGAGLTRFQNQYGHGNTQVDNLAGLPGSEQDFGLQELLLGANGHGIWQHDPAALQQLCGTYLEYACLQELPFYLTPKEGQLAIVEADAAPEASETIEIPTMPEASGARPWTQESWNQWNLLQHNGTRHPDRPFSKKYGFEPYL